MRLPIGEFRKDFCRHLDTMAETGEPVYVTNSKRSGEPTEAIAVSPELWAEILRVPSVRKRIAEHAAAKQAKTGQEGNLSDAA